jgi:hypothetical protein
VAFVEPERDAGEGLENDPREAGCDQAENDAPPSRACGAGRAR